MDKCRLSIIVPVYNAEDYLDRCLISIVEQDFVSYEVILVDDGSSDSSPLICDRYSAADPRFRTIHKKNGGVSSARNAGLDLAKGEYIMFVDSDDALLPDSLEMMFEHVTDEDMVVGGYTVYISGVPGREVLPRRNHSYRGEDMNVFYNENIRKNCEMLDAPWSKIFRRKTIGNLRFCEDLSYAEDKLFVFSFLAICSSACTCPFPVYAYHIRSGSLGSDIVSDRHLMQLRRFLPAYAEVLASLARNIPMVGELLTPALSVALMHWFRMHEYSADRAGAIAAGSPDGMIEGLGMCLGAAENLLGIHITTEDLLAQHQAQQEESDNLISRVILTSMLIGAEHPWATDRIHAMRQWKESGGFDQVIRKAA